MMFRSLVLWSGLTRLVWGLGEPRVISFPTFDAPDALSDQTIFTAAHEDGFIIASKYHRYAVPILLDSEDDVAIHLAAQTFVDDIFKVTGQTPRLYNDTLPKGTQKAIIAGSAGSRLIEGMAKEEYEGLRGKWESYDVRVQSKPVNGVEEALVAVGSDRVSGYPLFPYEDTFTCREMTFDYSLNIITHVLIHREERSTPCTPFQNNSASHHGISGPMYPSTLNRP